MNQAVHAWTQRYFSVDASTAGKGQLEISINGGRVPNNVEVQSAGRCMVTFIPYETGSYMIDVTLNNELVRGCPIRVDVAPATTAVTRYNADGDSVADSKTVLTEVSVHAKYMGMMPVQHHMEYTSSTTHESGLTGLKASDYAVWRQVETTSAVHAGGDYA
jgi:hypothetical protein